MSHETEGINRLPPFCAPGQSLFCDGAGDTERLLGRVPHRAAVRTLAQGTGRWLA